MKTDSTDPGLRTCVSPEGHFLFGLHQPRFSAANWRRTDHIMALGLTCDGQPHFNRSNFPPQDVDEPGADIIFEIPNPFPFRGATFICRSWAQQAAADPSCIQLPIPPNVSFTKTLHDADGSHTAENIRKAIGALPEPLQVALATTSTDSDDLVELAKLSCRFSFDDTSGEPTGLMYETDRDGRTRPHILNEKLFEATANNPALPDHYKQVMVLRPGVQGNSEIVGDWQSANSHVFEYLRRNSYVPWGHYAANMAHDSIRYRTGRLVPEDMQGMRHLYYQRTYTRLAEGFGLDTPPRRKMISASALEKLRVKVLGRLKQRQDETALPFTATLWGWNYGFGFAASGYRLHASHQQVHQQFALIPDEVPYKGGKEGMLGKAYACGDLVQDFIRKYRRETGKSFFDCYLQAIRNNRRLDGSRDKSADLIVYEDSQVILFVPKAQTSQWELQLMPLAPAGNILETDKNLRKALDRALLMTMRILTAMGAAMITVIEFSKRFNIQDSDQKLLYAFLPRIPESPGAFSEAQLRWINGHYPEDFAAACRLRLAQAASDLPLTYGTPGTPH